MDRPAHILVVGEPAICESCRQVLAPAGYKVNSAEGGREALEGARLGAFDLVVLDIGTDAAKSLDPEELAAADPPVVVITITGAEEDVAGGGAEAMEHSFETRKDFVCEAIPRSFTPERLLSAARRGMETRRLRVQVQELLSEREEIRRSVSRFLSTAAHELRAPLAAIESYLSAYLTGAAGPDPDLNRQMLERAKIRSHTLIDLVSDLLQYVRLESGGAPRKTVLFDPAGIIVDTVELFRVQAEERSISLIADIPDHLPLIEGHPSEMEQVFTNLISNAIKYNRDGGKVMVRAEAGKGTLRVSVADTGLGIDEEDLPRIFDEFFRVSRPETRYTTGTGMGLTIVRKIVESYSGKVRVESTIDAGTTVVVELPVHEVTNACESETNDS